jgi:hypothetical protein
MLLELQNDIEKNDNLYRKFSNARYHSLLKNEYFKNKPPALTMSYLIWEWEMMDISIKLSIKTY